MRAGPGCDSTRRPPSVNSTSIGRRDVPSLVPPYGELIVRGQSPGSPTIPDPTAIPAVRSLCRACHQVPPGLRPSPAYRGQPSPYAAPQQPNQPYFRRLTTSRARRPFCRLTVGLAPARRIRRPHTPPPPPGRTQPPAAARRSSNRHRTMPISRQVAPRLPGLPAPPVDAMAGISGGISPVTPGYPGFQPQPSLPPEIPATPTPLDVFVEETRTGQFMFGVTVNSNAGLIGNIVVQERNFDITNPPTSWDDFAIGRAWRGGGQSFRIEAQPGTVLQRYLVSFTDPYFLGHEHQLRRQRLLLQPHLFRLDRSAGRRPPRAGAIGSRPTCRWPRRCAPKTSISSIPASTACRSSTRCWATTTSTAAASR